MGKRAREKKEQKVSQLNFERQQVEERRKARMAEAVAFSKKVIITLIATALLLYTGVFVNNRLGEILQRFIEKG